MYGSYGNQKGMVVLSAFRLIYVPSIFDHLETAFRDNLLALLRFCPLTTSWAGIYFGNAASPYSERLGQRHLFREFFEPSLASSLLIADCTFCQTGRNIMELLTDIKRCANMRLPSTFMRLSRNCKTSGHSTP